MPLSKSLQIKLQINISINTVTGLVLKNPIALIIPDSGDTIAYLAKIVTKTYRMSKAGKSN
jgi:hypothetical protein